MQFRDEQCINYNLSQGPWPRKPVQFLDNDTLVDVMNGVWQCCLSMWRSKVWNSDAMLISGWSGGVPIIVQSGGIPIFVRSGGVTVKARFRYELTSKCWRWDFTGFNCSWAVDEIFDARLNRSLWNARRPEVTITSNYVWLLKPTCCVRFVRKDWSQT